MGSGRSLLRRASILLIAGCAALVLAFPASAQGPKPDPAPPTPQPKPEPPGARPQPAPQPPPAPPPPPPVARVQPAPQPSPSPSPAPPPPAVVFRNPVVSPPPAAPAPRTQTRAERRARPVAKKKAQTARVAGRKQALKRSSVPKPPAAASAAVDKTLMIGGLALVVLVLGDAVFLALSTRFLRVL